ncbi:MAG: YkgJ family cysteine cluster protein [Candidatus Alkanophagales archaeon]
MLRPWRELRWWECRGCGRCCFDFRPRLLAYEALKLEKTGFVEYRDGKFYIRKVGGVCPFLRGGLCSLQGELKPTTCKIFPFSVHRRGDDRALYLYKGRKFYVYVDDYCPNVVLGGDGDAEILVREVVRIVTGELSESKLLTAPASVTRPHPRAWMRRRETGRKPRAGGESLTTWGGSAPLGRGRAGVGGTAHETACRPDGAASRLDDAPHGAGRTSAWRSAARLSRSTALGSAATRN